MPDKILLIGPRLPVVGGISIYISILEQKLQEKKYLVFPITPYVFHMSDVKLRELLSLSFFHNILLKIIFFLRNIVEIIKIRKRGKISFAHIHTAGGINFFENGGYQIVLKILKIPAILHIHSTVLHENYAQGNFIKKRVLKWIIFSFDSIIVLSPSWRQVYITTFNLPEERIFIVTNAAGLVNFQELPNHECKQKLGIAVDKKVIFSFGSLISRKGFIFLIDAMNLISTQKPEICCYIGGEGEDKSILQQRIKDFNLEKKAFLPGFLSDAELSLWMNACDIFVLPSLNEGFPLVQIEAMMCGKPVVATYNGGSEDIIISEKFGLLCEKANPKSLAGAILTAVDKEWKSKEIQEYGQTFNWDRTLHELFIVYKNLTNEHS